MAHAVMEGSEGGHEANQEPLWIRLLKNKQLQSFAAKTPILKGLVRRDQRRVFDLMSGFVYTQVLFAAVEIDLFAQLLKGSKSANQIRGISPEAALLLCRALAGIGLLREGKDGDYSLTRHGAIIETIPGLKTMIRHHAVLYRDLEHPLAVLEGQSETEMAGFWPYVFGATDRPVSEAEATLYSQVMTDTQALVAREVLSQVPMSGLGSLLDIGGGHGAFLGAVKNLYPDLRLGLFDLPNVVEAVSGFDVFAGNFRTDDLPCGFEAISLIRIMFDHQDQTVSDLLGKIFDALPEGGHLIVAEPMAGKETPTAEGDAYYALYTRAMQTGKTRRPQDIAQLITRSGFSDVKIYPDRSPAVARVIRAIK